MKKSTGLHIATGKKHANPKPRLRTRHLSSTGKSAYGAAGGAGIPAFPAGPGAAPGGAPAFGDPGAGGADSSPMMGPGGGPPGM